MTAWVKEFRIEELGTSPIMTSGRWKRYVSKDPNGHGLIYGMGMLMPGEEAGHAHEEEEGFYVLQGHGEATWVVDGVTHTAELKPGVAFYKTPHIHHTMRNTGTEPLIGIVCKV
jgi:mannose-6-phosphate isomerase-like protein (cupin superfamily)